MKQQLLIVSIAALLCGQPTAVAQTKPETNGERSPRPRPAQRQTQPQPPPRPVSPQRLDLADYGIRIEPDQRLIVMMAALDAAGWDPTPPGAQPSVFREVLRKDLAGLDPNLRARMKDFYERHKLKDVADNPSTPEDETVRYTIADQAAAYISVAYALGPAPSFEAPPRSDDLPAGVLDVLDFVTLMREFYRQSGMDAQLPKYVKMHRAAGDALRAPVMEMARSVLAYLNTRPVTEVEEKILAEDPTKSGKKKDAPRKTVTRVRERWFVVTPDLLAAPGAINFRVIADDYFAVAPEGTDPRASELRRAYVQYTIDPLVLRFNREVAAKRAEIKQVLDAEAARQKRLASPDVFLAVARSMVVAADARMDAAARLRALQIEMSNRLQSAKDEASRAAALKESKERQQAIEDETTARLAEGYERGAVLAFFFSEQLRDIEGAGFDVANFIPNMFAAIDPARELKRPAEYATAVARHRETRRRAQQARAGDASLIAEPPEDGRRAALIKSLRDVEKLLELKNYEEVETRLTALKNEHREDARIYFLLGQSASLSAQDAFDGALQEQRLNAALGHFRQAILFATPDTDRAIALRAHLASGRILAHFERKDEALREFDAVIAKTNAQDLLHQEALKEKRKLAGQ